jgi:hypothetical protein
MRALRIKQAEHSSLLLLLLQPAGSIMRDGFARFCALYAQQHSCMQHISAMCAPE